MSVLKLSDVLRENENKRIDSDYFKKQFLEFFRNVKNIYPLGNFVKEGYRVVYENTKIIDSKEGKQKGFPYFLQATDLDTPFIKTDRLYYVDEEEWQRYIKGRIQKGEILDEEKGKIDKVAIVQDDFAEKTLVSGSLFKLSVNDKISKHILLSYLICKYGKAFKDRFKTNLLISYISKPDLYRIPIPKFSIEFQKKVDELFENIFKFQKQSKQTYTQAENLLLEELGLKDFKSSKEKVNIKNFKESFLSTGRLDAEYYQPKYEEIQKIMEHYINGYYFVRDVFNHETEKIERTEKKYYYSEISDVNISDGTIYFYLIPTEKLPVNGKMKLSFGNIIISKVRPYRGAVAIIRDAPANYVGSGAFTVLSEKGSYKKEVLQILLRSKPYKELMMKYNVGSSYPVIKDYDILNLPIPIIEQNIQQQISDKIEESFRLKKQSEQLLELAKTAVEMAIEVDEEKAMEFIEKSKF